MFLKGSGCGGNICKKVYNFQFWGHNVLIYMSRLLAQRRWKVALAQITIRDIAIEDPIISFRDIEEDLKTQIWLQIQNGNPDQHQNAHCTSLHKGLCIEFGDSMWCGFGDLRCQRGGVDKKSKIKDSTETKKKNNKDSERLRNLLIINFSSRKCMHQKVGVY